MTDDIDLVLLQFLYDSLGIEKYDVSFAHLRDEFRGDESQQDVGHTKHLQPAVRSFAGDESDLSVAEVEEYDNNIRAYLDTLNSARDTEIELRYYQYIAVFVTEYYLDMLSNNTQALQTEFNSFIQSRNVDARPTLSVQDATRMQKIAYWMATGSGKTYICHINYRQFINYFGDSEVDNVVLIAPKKEIARQHVDEFSKNGIDASRISNSTDADVLVTDFDRLRYDEDGDKIVDVKDYRGDNLVFVDEGHKGLGSMNAATSESGWEFLREKLAGDGYIFEYSATYGAAIKDEQKYQEYGRSIIFDYPYGRFHADGYGKDYNILNISADNRDSDYWSEKRDEWLLLNLLSYYKKLRLYETDANTMKTYNIEKPLSVFVGDRVTSARNGDKTDVERLVSFLARVLTDSEWVIDFIERTLNHRTEFQTEMDLFTTPLSTLSEDAESVYSDLLQRVFDSTGGTLEVHQLNNDDGEIALKTTDATEYFGVVTIGNDDEFMELMESVEGVSTSELKTYTTLLFEQINHDNSSIRLLIGSRKFSEGWDSTRPTTMGLLNLGRSKGPATVQLFGRGVRVNGRNKDGKRELHPNQTIATLQTLDVFGLRSNYIEQFKESLKQERVTTEDTTVKVTVEKDPSIGSDSGPVYQRPQTTMETDETVPTTDFSETVDSVNAPTIEIGFGVQQVTSTGSSHTDDSYGVDVSDLYLDEDMTIHGEHVSLDILDWGHIYHSVVAKSPTEVVIQRGDIEDCIRNREYRLIARSDFLSLPSVSHLDRVHDICVKIGVRLAKRVHTHAATEHENEAIELKPITENDWIDEVIPDQITLDISSSGTLSDELLEEIQEIESIEDIASKQHASEVLLVLAKHLYDPIAVSDENDSTTLLRTLTSVDPTGINEGEQMFLISLENVDEREQIEALAVLRNPPQTGVGFQSAGGYYPDFILWVQTQDTQHVAFIDPKGMQIPTEEKIQKVKFGKEIAGSIDDTSVSLHSYIIARADVTQSGTVRSRDEIIETWTSILSEYDGTGEERLNNANVYVQETASDGTVESILSDILKH